VRATAVDSSRISVSWEPGPFPNGPVLSYVLQINELPEGYSALKVSERGPYHASAQLPVSFNKNIRLSAYSFISLFLLVCSSFTKSSQKVYKAYILKRFFGFLMWILHYYMDRKLFFYTVNGKIVALII
jgi:hypothetical protein